MYMPGLKLDLNRERRGGKRKEGGKRREGGDESATDSRSVFGLVAGIHKQLHYRVFVC